MPSFEGVNPESLSHMGLNRYRVVIDGQTDRITIASTRLALRAVARKKNQTYILQATLISRDERSEALRRYLAAGFRPAQHLQRPELTRQNDTGISTPIFDVPLLVDSG